jgi:hypothetical protein
MCSQQCLSFFSLMNPHIILAEYECTHTCYYFIFGYKFRMGNRWQLLRGFPWRLLGLGQLVALPCGAETPFESCYLLFRLLCWELRDVISWCMYTVMILLLVCRLMCVTIPEAHIRCMHSILSFNWSVTPTSPFYSTVWQGPSNHSWVERPRSGREIKPNRPLGLLARRSKPNKTLTHREPQGHAWTT